MLFLRLHILKFTHKLLFWFPGFVSALESLHSEMTSFSTRMVSKFNVEFLNCLEFDLVDSVMSKSTFLFPRWSQVFRKDYHRAV